MSLAASSEDAPRKPKRKNSKARNGSGPKPQRTPRLTAPERTRERPTFYSEEVMDEIMRRVSHGETLTQACASNPGFPSHSTVIDWVHQDRHGLADRYARARDQQVARWADDIIDTSNKATPETVNALRLVVDSKKWLIARLRPAQYGDRVTADITSGGKPLASASDLDIAKALAHLLSPALPAPELLDVEAVPVKEEGEQP
jgi:hypothetical protein